MAENVQNEGHDSMAGASTICSSDEGLLQSRKNILFELIKERKETEFLEMYANYDKPNDDDGTKTFLQYSCDKNCFEIVKFLCKNGADIEKKAINEPKEMKPLRLALDHGYYKIVEFLVEKGAEIDADLLSFSIKSRNWGSTNEYRNYKKCLDVLVNSENFHNINININKKDQYGNTPLYNSVRWGLPSLTETLLQKGAYLGSRNNLDFMPIHFINPDVLEKHLDSCIELSKMGIASGNDSNSGNDSIALNLDTLIPEHDKSKQNEEPVTNDSLELGTLIPRQNVEPVTNNSLEGEGKFSETGFNTETTIINFMANSPKLQHLLKHPVIVCFLLMKWHRIRCLFYTNITFYSIFVLSLYTYIFMKYTNSDTNSNSVPYTIVATASFIVLNVTYVLLWLRELFQFVVSRKRYLKNLENFIEICLLVITSIILFPITVTNNVKKEVSAFAIVFSAFELVLMIGQLPIFTTYVIMFKKVLGNFVLLFLWSLVLIIAFAFSFNVLFSKSNRFCIPTNSSSDCGQTNSSSHGGQTNSSSDGGGKKEDDVFGGLLPSLFNTLMMLTMELDMSSIDFHTHPVWGRLMYIIFVFAIIIILMNLLNGLAVNDTQTIKNDAELVGHIDRAKRIYYFETLFIGNVLEKNRFLNYLKNLFGCCPHNISLNGNFMAEKLCLFTELKNNKNIFMLNQEGCLTLTEKDEKAKMNCCNGCVADKKTIQTANNIIAQKEKMNLVLEFDKLKIEQNVLKEKLDEVLCILKN